MKIAIFVSTTCLAAAAFMLPAAACGGKTAGEHAANPSRQTLSQLKRNLGIIRRNHTELAAAKAMKSLRAAIAKRTSDCRREGTAAYQLRTARERAASRFTARYIPRKLCI